MTDFYKKEVQRTWTFYNCVYIFAMCDQWFSARTKRTLPSQNTAPPPSQSSAAANQQPSGSAPMSGWAGYKHKQWGGYLDNLSEPARSSTLTATPASTKRDYKEAEREYLLEAKSLAAVVLQCFEDARKLKGQGQTYQDALAKANQEKAKVDDLLARAREMKELNERSSVSPWVIQLNVT